ncbi:MAG: hypothetical protein ACFFEF_04695 [Candidatus Thorarchaeota archaeon]
MINPTHEIEALITFTEIGSNIVAVLPYVLPMLMGSILFLLYQRYLPREERRRNATLAIGILGVVSSLVLVLYAGFGSMWWGPEGLTFGSYDVFIAILQRVSNMAFAYSIVYSLIYLFSVVVIFTLMARYVIHPPNPDFEQLRGQMKEISSSVESKAKENRELSAENKRLNEFLKEKEESLSLLNSELEALKVSVGERDSSIAEMESRLRETPDSSAEEELLTTISKKDQTISRLQSEIADLQLMLESSGAKAPPQAQAPSGLPDSELASKMQQLEEKLKKTESLINDYTRRSETALEVSDSVISDLAELISQIGSSGLDNETKKALSGLIEGLGRAMGRISGRPDDEREAPKVELIGAIMMVHEIVDGVKKLARK